MDANDRQTKYIICRLCLSVINRQFNIIDETTKEAIDILLLKLNFELSEYPVICEECLENITKSVNFKLVCVDTEELITLFGNDGKMTNFEIKDILQNEKNNHCDVKYFDMCRFCINPVDINDFVLLDVLTQEPTFKKMLFEYMSEMDFNIIKNPIICSHCRDNLECYFKFIRNCVDVEQKINTFYQVEGSEGRSQVKLCSVRLHFLFKDNPECSSTSEGPENEHCEPYSKLMKIEEELFIKDERDNFSEPYSKLMKIEEELFIKDERDNFSDNSVVDTCRSLLETPFDQHSEIQQNDSDEYCSGAEANKQIILRARQGQSLKSDGVKKYRCSVCSFEAKRLHLVKKHMKVHKYVKKEEIYQCSLCTYETKYRHDFNYHTLVHKDVSEIKMHKCSLCAAEFTLKCNLRRHIRIVHMDVSELKMYRCPSCPYESKAKNDLKRHMLIHKNTSEITMYKCSLCDYQARLKGNLKRHTFVHKDVSALNMHKCPLCTYKSKYKYILDIHMAVHKDVSEIQMFKCPSCTYESRIKGNLKKHMIIHKDVSEMEILKCSLCAYETRRKDSLHLHMRYVHKDISEIKMHKCPLCAHQTKYKSSLTRHMLVHKDISEIKMYKCRSCKRKFKQKGGLKQHMLRKCHKKKHS